MEPRHSGTVGFPALGKGSPPDPADVLTRDGREMSPRRVFRLFLSKVVTFNRTYAETQKRLRLDDRLLSHAISEK